MYSGFSFTLSAQEKNNVPRPIRVGELWRRAIGKRMVADNKEKITNVCKDFRQYGVGIPGGTDALIHFRMVLEELGQTGSIDTALAIIDVDFQNAFPSFG